MMATRADPGFMPAPKKNMTTYGKASRKKPLPSNRAASSSEQSTSPMPPLTSASAKSEEDVTRSQANIDNKPRQHTAAKESSRPAIQAGSSASGERVATGNASKPSKANPAIKRKPSQPQSISRPSKKQRSSSPDSSPLSQPVAKTSKQVAKQSLASAMAAPRGPTTPPEDVTMKNTASTMPFSPGTVKTLDTLAVGARKTTAPQKPIPLRPTAKPQAKPGSVAAPQSDAVAAALPKAVQAPAKPRRRLIDALASQAEASSDDDEGGDDEGEQDEPRISRRSPVKDELMTLDHGSPMPASPGPNRTRVMPRQAPLSTKKPGVKFTYSQQRTVLAEDPFEGLAGGDDFMSQPLLPNSQSNLTAFSFDDDDGAATTGAVRSVHELRQAGANNRFADELDDILDRIGKPTPGKPSSMRRSALLDLSQKLRDKSFLRQFRNHSGETTLFRDLGKETDAIAGYALCCILATLLASSASTHLYHELKNQGISQLIATLLPNELDIAAIARDRKSNVSKHGQSLLLTTKSAVLELDVWESPQVAPSQLSPRTLALKCLELILQKSRSATGADELISSQVTEQLFEILSAAIESPDSSYWDFPSKAEAMDLFLTLSLLELQSVWVTQSDDVRSGWTSGYLLTVAEMLGTSLRRQGDRTGAIECLALKLALNTANNNPTAQAIFMKKGLLQDLVEAVCGTFEDVLKSITSDDFLIATLDSLVLMLGVMINFTEHDPSACQTLVQDETDSPLARLIRIFLNYRSTTAEADSVEKTQMNVAFGYLSVLLGYLCLYRPIRQGFGSLEPLLASIREFIAYHKAADHAIEIDDESSSFTGRLQSLVDQLESTC